MKLRTLLMSLMKMRKTMRTIKSAGKRRTHAHEESQLQRDCVTWFRLQYPSHALMLFAVPNGGGRSPIEAAIMKAEGVVAGVADLILLEARGNYGALCIEMKTRSSKSRQSTNQKIWQEATQKAGNAYVVVRTFEDFQAVIRQYLALKPLNSLF